LVVRSFASQITIHDGAVITIQHVRQHQIRKSIKTRGHFPDEQSEADRV
jgi:hypothetical protein